MMTPDELESRLRADLRAAMRDRRMEEVRVIRALIAVLDNATAVPVADRPASLQHRFGEGSAEVARRELSTADVQEIVAREVADRMNAAAQLDDMARTEAAQAMRAEAELVRRYLM